MAIHFTPAQQKVLDARDHNILVSAAAGSGKTAVLVERIVRLVSEGDHPLDIDRLLVVTFTRAAAAQMRERIGRALSARIAEDPSNAHLQRQEVLLHNAQITTMDSFFTFLLRNYFSDIDLDPGFRQIEATESGLIGAEVLHDFLEEKYAEKDPAFLRCAEYFCPGADDGPLEELILELSKRAGSHPSPEAWLKERAFDYDVPDEQTLFSTVWMRSTVLRLADFLIETGSRYDAMLDLCREPGGPDVCYAFLKEEQQGVVRDIASIRRELALLMQEESGLDGENTDQIPLLKKLWEEVLLGLQWEFKRFPTIRGKKYDYIDPVIKDAVKSMRDAERDLIRKLSKSVGGQTPDLILAMMACAREPMQTLSALTAEYSRRFLETKKERHLIDFVDLEHFALDILAERQEDGTYVPRRAARALRSHYAEILIDEYQDSNEVQELLLQIISGEDDGHNNRFMVGDIKQSIYRFRLARPEIFMDKYDSYRPDDPLTERIELDQNFRSRAQVLDFVNTLFMRIMRREVGGVEYNEIVSLKKGAVFPDEEQAGSRRENAEDPDPYCAELLLLETLADGGTEEDGTADESRDDPDEEGVFQEDEYTVLSDEIGSLSERQKEALLIAGKIRQMVGSLPVRDEETGELRPARYGDIVILLRSTVGWNEDLRAVFAREGIPAYAESRTGYFAAQEIRDIIEMLRVLDNPRQDIPLYGTMRGFFGGFTQDEISMIRIGSKEGMLYDALCSCAESQEASVPADLVQKCRTFLDFVNGWRRRVQFSPVSEIVTGLLEETGYQDYCTALPAGAQRSANLRFLCSQADAFTKTDFTGLFQFLRYLDGLHRQEMDYGEANTLDENADVVRIMSIHKSKGLEFPICFAAGLSKDFSFRRFDTSGPMLFDGDWGVGINYFDPVSRVSTTTLRREEIAEKIRRDCMGEELRVLYVALTRAKEKLIMTASLKDVDKKIKNWKAAMAGFFHDRNAQMLSPFMIAGASSFTQLICQALMAGAGPEFEITDPAQMMEEGQYADLPVRIQICSQNDLSMQAVEEQFDLSRSEEILRGMEGRSLEAQPDPEAAGELAYWFFRTYPHEDLRNLYATTSVSELKHRAMRTLQTAEEGTTESPAELFPDQTPVPYLPAFAREDEEEHMDMDSDPGSGARRGTAFHRVLELMVYEHRDEWIGSLEGHMKLTEWLKGLPAGGKISEEDLGLVSVSRLLHFLQSPLAERMARDGRCGQLFREQPFVMGVPADQAGQGLPHDEMVMIQGIIDAFMIEDGKIVLVDYKTDRVNEAGELIARYKTQLDLYAEALQKAFGIPAAQKLIYSTALGCEISL